MSAKSIPGKKSRPIKKRPGKTGSQGRSTSVSAPQQSGYKRYQGLESIKSRPEEDRSLPVGSRGKNPAEFRKYGQHSKHIQLDSDLSWTDARKAADILIKTCPPLTADLTAKQRLGYEHLITDVLFHVPKFGHELLAGGEGSYAGLNLKDRTYFKTAYGSQLAISGNAAKISTGDLLRCLQLAKTDFNKWSYDMKDIIPDEERKFPHYLTTGRLQKALEENPKFKYVPANFFTDFRFAQVIEEEEAENDSGEDEDLGNESGSSTITSLNSASESKMMQLLTQINDSQMNLSKRIQKVESKMGVVITPLKEGTSQQPRNEESLKPRKIDLVSPEKVKIETTTAGESAFKDIASFRLFNDTFQSFMLEMEGITKNPSANKKRKTDANWCLESLATKFGIDTSDASAPVLKEHVAHMATVNHLFKHYSEELKKGNFKDPNLVPMKKRKWGDDE